MERGSRSVVSLEKNTKNVLDSAREAPKDKEITAATKPAHIAPRLLLTFLIDVTAPDPDLVEHNCTSLHQNWFCTEGECRVVPRLQSASLEGATILDFSKGTG